MVIFVKRIDLLVKNRYNYFRNYCLGSKENI